MVTQHDQCDECGFEYDLGQAPSAGAGITAGARRLGDLLQRYAEPAARRREGVWSPLEYCCHVRDVLLVQRERVLLARRVDCPSLVPMGRDERVVHDGYEHQRPDDVARQLSDAALLFAGVLSRLDTAAWQRRVIYNFPDESERSVEWVAVHTLHEVRHHLGDVERQLATPLTSTSSNVHERDR